MSETATPRPANAGGTGGPLMRMWERTASEDHVLLAPVVSFAAFAVVAIGDRSVAASVVALLLQVALFQIAVTAHIRRPRIRRILFIAAPFVVAGVFALIGIVASTYSADWGRGLAALFSAAMTAGVIVRIFGGVARAPVIDALVVIRAVTVYLLLGLLFCYLFIAMSVTGEPFFVQGPQPNTTFLYFSYVTLATIGYGDYTPAYDAGRFLAVAEGLMGQLYLVTVVALIVSNLGRSRNPLDEGKEQEARGAETPTS